MNGLLSDPFLPTSISDPMTYVGRETAVARITDIFRDLISGQPRHFAITGERGLGKSSLLEFTATLAAMEMQDFRPPAVTKDKLCNLYPPLASLDFPKLRYAPVRISLDAITDNVIFRKKIIETLHWTFDRCAGEGKKILKEFLDKRLKGIRGPMGIGFDLSGKDARTRDSWVVEEAVSEIAEVAIRLARNSEPNGSDPLGFVLLIDEADLADTSILDLGTVLKGLIELLSANRCRNVVIGLGGLPNLRKNIIETHMSAWRAFEEIDLKPLQESALKDLLTSCLGRARALQGAQQKITPPAINLLVSASEGYPHWLRQYAAAALIEHEGNGPLVEADVLKGSSAALAKIGDSYYRFAYDSLAPLGRRILHWLVLGKLDGHLPDELYGLLGDASTDVDAALQVLRDKGLVSIPPNAEKECIKIASRGFRKWIALDIKDEILPREWPSVSDIAFHLDERDQPIVIWGEDVPAFVTQFAGLLTEDVEGRGSELFEFNTYDATQLFDVVCAAGQKGLPEIDLVLRQLAKDLQLSSETQTTINIPPDSTASPGSNADRPTMHKNIDLDQMWDADIVAIPHYLLGYAVDRGVENLDLLAAKEPQLSNCRKYLNHMVLGFPEICTYEKAWVAIPFSVVAKILYYRTKAGKSGLNSDVERCFDEMVPLHDGSSRVLTEAKPLSLSLWYEWQQLGAPRNARTLKRLHGESEVNVSRYTTQLSSNGSSQGQSLDVLRWYHSLIASQQSTDVGKYSWSTAPSQFIKDSSYDAYLGWSDWGSVILNGAGTSGHAGLGVRELQKRNTLSDKSGGQPLEAWVFVLPQTGNSLTRSRRQRRLPSLLRMLLGTMRLSWQRKFQEACGCSPSRNTLIHPDMASRQPWTRILMESISEDYPKGKRPAEFYRMKAEMLWLSSVLFDSDEGRFVAKPLSAAWPSEVSDHTAHYVKAINEINKIERDLF